MNCVQEQLKKTTDQYNPNTLDCKKTKRMPIIASVIAFADIEKDIAVLRIQITFGR